MPGQEEKNWLQESRPSPGHSLSGKSRSVICKSSRPIHVPSLMVVARCHYQSSIYHLHAAVDDLIGERYSDALDRIEPLQKRISELQGQRNLAQRATSAIELSG